MTEPLTTRTLTEILHDPTVGDDAVRGIIAASMCRYADRVQSGSVRRAAHLSTDEDVVAFRGRSIDLLQRWGFPEMWIELHANAWDWIVDDANLWLQALHS